MRPCTGALIGGIIYSRTKEESCPAKPAARSFPYSTRRQLPARENHTDAKEPPFFCVGFFHRSCLRCAKGNGCALPLRLAKVQKRWSFSLYGCLFHRPCLRCTKGNGYSLPLRLAKVQKRGPFSLCGFLPPTFCKQKAALSRRKRRLLAGEINKITSRVQRPAFRSNSSSCWPVARSQAVNTPFSYSI